MISEKWAMDAERGSVPSRCSSMPPDYLTQTISSKAYPEIRETENLYNKNVINRCISPRPISGGRHFSMDYQPAHTILPNDLSVITDEDSGYSPTPYASCKQAGSSGSIANSGPVTSDDTGASSIACRDELLHVMTEDLVDWFLHMYPNMTGDLEVENFFDKLSDGALLCHHAAELHHRLHGWSHETHHNGRLQAENFRVGGIPVNVPQSPPAFQTRGLQGSSASTSFVSRVNVSNFLVWCRQLGMPDSVLFESEDLVCRKNPRNVAVCLLELARLGGRFGMEIPELIRLEVDIDNELAAQCDSSQVIQECLFHGTVDDNNADRGKSVCSCRNGPNPRGYKETRSANLRRNVNQKAVMNKHSKATAKQPDGPNRKETERKRPVVDMRSLDEIVRDLLSQCTCKQTFPMIRVGEGRYLFGDKCTQIFVRVLRNHVMVRVGGGWDTLNHFLSKYDECRKVNPPNCRLPPDQREHSSEKVDTSDPEKILRSIRSPQTVADSLIIGEGSLNAVKRSPVKSQGNSEKTKASISKNYSNQTLPYENTQASTADSADVVNTTPPSIVQVPTVPARTMDDQCTADMHAKSRHSELPVHVPNTCSPKRQSGTRIAQTLMKAESVDANSSLQALSRPVKSAVAQRSKVINTTSKLSSQASRYGPTTCSDINSMDSKLSQSTNSLLHLENDSSAKINSNASKVSTLTGCRNSEQLQNRDVRNGTTLPGKPLAHRDRSKACKGNGGSKQFRRCSVQSSETVKNPTYRNQPQSSTVNYKRTQSSASHIPQSSRCSSTSRAAIHPCSGYPVSDL